MDARIKSGHDDNLTITVRFLAGQGQPNVSREIREMTKQPALREPAPVRDPGAESGPQNLQAKPDA